MANASHSAAGERRMGAPAGRKGLGRSRERLGARTRPAAIFRVVEKLVAEFAFAQRLVRAGAHVGFAHFAYAAVLQNGADVTGEVLRILVLGIDHVADFRGERTHGRVVDPRLAELLEAGLAVKKADCDAVGRGEFCRIAIGRRMFSFERLPEAVNRPLAHFAEHVDDYAGPELAQELRCSYVSRLDHATARIIGSDV